MLASARGIPFALRDTVNSVVGVRLRNVGGYVLPTPLWPNRPVPFVAVSSSRNSRTSAFGTSAICGKPPTDLLESHPQSC